MKGTLKKTEQGWVVRHTGYVPPHEYELPLHPYQDPNYEFGRDMNGEEVEFDVEEFWETGITAPFNVAKLKKNNVREDDVEKLAEEWFESKGYNIYNHYNTMPSFIEGYNKCKEKTYTEGQVKQAIEMSKDIKYITYSTDEIIQSLKQPK